MNTRTLIITFVWMIMSNIGIFAQEHWDAQERIELNKGVLAVACAERGGKEKR